MPTATTIDIDCATLQDGTMEFLCPSQVRITVAPGRDARQKPLVTIEHDGKGVLSTKANLLYLPDIREMTNHCGTQVEHIEWHKILTQVGIKMLDIPSTSGNVRKQAVSATDFLNQTGKHVIAADIRDFVIPGCITLVAAPRASGKTIVTLGIAIALSTGGIFRGQHVPRRRVLYVDRDNPPALLRRHIAALGAAGVTDLHLLTRTSAPSLLDKAAWDAFPVSDYDVVIVDSIGSATEGVSEKEGAQSQQALATLKDLAHRGPAVVGLDNTIKSGLSYRGRGEKADAVDILYEARNVTGWTPESASHWWEQLPDAGEHAWQRRATRRTGKAELRVAFIPSKYRLDIEPEPFVLAVDTRQVPWAVSDITAAIEQAGVDAAAAARQAAQTKLASAEAALIEAIRKRGPHNPMTLDEAETVLRAHDLTRAAARNLLKKGGNRDIYPAGTWVLRQIPNHPRHNAMGVYLAEEKNGGEQNTSGTIPHKDSRNEDALHADGSTPRGEHTVSMGTAENMDDQKNGCSPQPGMHTASKDTVVDKQNSGKADDAFCSPPFFSSPGVEEVTDDELPF